MSTSDSRRPASGFGHYVRDMVYGALDGAITTMAIVAATSGARLSPSVALMLGLANLIADGISMGASNYLALKSELEQEGKSVAKEAPWRHGAATAAAFAVVGGVPLVAYAGALAVGLPAFAVSACAAVVVLAAAGAVRAPFVRKPAWKSAGEMVAVGALAGGAAYAVGAVARGLW